MTEANERVMKKGKFRGRALREVPSGYLNWVLKQDGYDPDVSEAAKETLKARLEGTEPEPEASNDTIYAAPVVTRRPRKYVKVGPCHVVDAYLVNSIRPSRKDIVDQDDADRKLEFIVVFEQGSFSATTKAPNLWVTREEAQELAQVLLNL